MLLNAKLPVQNTNTLPFRTMDGAAVITISDMPLSTEDQDAERKVDLGVTISIKISESLLLLLPLQFLSNHWEHTKTLETVL